MEKQGINENTVHSRLNALKFYSERVLHRDKFFCEIPRPKKATELPKIFNQDEIASVINSVANLKHKVMLMLACSAGLHVSEVVDLKTYEIDSKRMTILIIQKLLGHNDIKNNPPLRAYQQQRPPENYQPTG